MTTTVLPAFENYLLREISVRKVDQFIKTLAGPRATAPPSRPRLS